MFFLNWLKNVSIDHLAMPSGLIKEKTLMIEGKNKCEIGREQKEGGDISPFRNDIPLFLWDNIPSQNRHR